MRFGCCRSFGALPAFPYRVFELAVWMSGGMQCIALHGFPQWDRLLIHSRFCSFCKRASGQLRPSSRSAFWGSCRWGFCRMPLRSMSTWTLTLILILALTLNLTFPSGLVWGGGTEGSQLGLQHPLLGFFLPLLLGAMLPDGTPTLV